jgi:protein-S-isoprenylcysteine O-methyltransferase Ste14
MFATETGPVVRRRSFVARFLTLVYGVVCYVIFLGVFGYLIGFVEDWMAPASVDAGGADDGPVVALAIDLLLLGTFAAQHTTMARPRFEAWWARHLPAALERSTYVLCTSVVVLLLVRQWRPLPGIVWAVDDAELQTVVTGLSIFGWCLVVLSTFLIDHFELFGIRQTVRYAMNLVPDQPTFEETLLYRWVRHPLMLGLLVAFWATPVMTHGHLLFAVVMTAYVLVAIRIEERALVSLHGEPYRDYQRRVPMLLPIAYGPVPELRRELPASQ